MADTTLVDTLICAAAQAWKDDGEVLATGIGLVPRLAASLAKLTVNPDLMMTDSEAWLVSEPVPVGPRGDYRIKREAHMGFAHLRQRLGRQASRDGRADADRPLWSGQHLDDRLRLPASAHADARRARLPGNSINHANSFFVPNHSPKVFVEGEVDMVCLGRLQPGRLARGWSLDEIDIRLVVTQLCVMDFGGPATSCGCAACIPGSASTRCGRPPEIPLRRRAPRLRPPKPDPSQVLARLDPHGLRASAPGKLTMPDPGDNSSAARTARSTKPRAGAVRSRVAASPP